MQQSPNYQAVQTMLAANLGTSQAFLQLHGTSQALQQQQQQAIQLHLQQQQGLQQLQLPVNTQVQQQPQQQHSESSLQQVAQPPKRQRKRGKAAQSNPEDPDTPKEPAAKKPRQRAPKKPKGTPATVEPKPPPVSKPKKSPAAPQPTARPVVKPRPRPKDQPLVEVHRAFQRENAEVHLWRNAVYHYGDAALQQEADEAINRYQENAQLLASCFDGQPVELMDSCTEEHIAALKETLHSMQQTELCSNVTVEELQERCQQLRGKHRIEKILDVIRFGRQFRAASSVEEVEEVCQRAGVSLPHRLPDDERSALMFNGYWRKAAADDWDPTIAESCSAVQL